MKINIFGVDVDNYSLEEIIKIIIDRALAGVTPGYVIILNNRPLIPLPETSEKNSINGIELLVNLFTEATNRGLKVFFLGDSYNTAKLAIAKLQQQHPRLQISFYCPAFGFERDSTELTKIERTVKNAAPDLLFVRSNTPTQERWLAANYQQLGVPISLSTSMSFRLIAEIVRGTPTWIQQTGLEWLYHRLINY